MCVKLCMYVCVCVCVCVSVCIYLLVGYVDVCVCCVSRLAYGNFSRPIFLYDKQNYTLL